MLCAMRILFVVLWCVGVSYLQGGGGAMFTCGVLGYVCGNECIGRHAP